MIQSTYTQAIPGLQGRIEIYTVNGELMLKKSNIWNRRCLAPVVLSKLCQPPNYWEYNRMMAFRFIREPISEEMVKAFYVGSSAPPGDDYQVSLIERRISENGVRIVWRTPHALRLNGPIYGIAYRSWYGPLCSLIVLDSPLLGEDMMVIVKYTVEGRW